MPGPLDRFRHLERPRREGAADEVPDPTARIEAVEAGGAVADAGIPAESIDRFREPPERPLAIDERPEDEQPFVRCAWCEADNTRYATECEHCHAKLDTPMQRKFNDVFWARRRQDAAAEKRALEVLQEDRTAQADAEARARREGAEAMAREIERAERRRLEMDDPRWGDPTGAGGAFGGTPYGIRLLRLVPNPYVRIALVVAAVALPVALIALGGRRSGMQLAGVILISLVLSLVAPPGRGRRWRW